MIEIRYWHRHPGGTRPGWQPRWVRHRRHTLCKDPSGKVREILESNFFAVNWRDKEVIIEWERRLTLQQFQSRQKRNK